MFNSSKIKTNEHIYPERFRVLQILLNVTHLNQIYGELMGIATNSGFDSQLQNEKIKLLMSNPILKESALCGEPDELYALWNVFFVYHYINKNFRESYLAKKKQFELYGESNVFYKTRPKTQLLLLGNLTSLAFNLLDAKEFEFAYTEMLKAHDKVQGFEGLKFEQRSAFGLLRFKFQKDYSGLEKHVAYITENLAKHKNGFAIVREMDTYFNVAIAFFRKKDFGKALDWLNKILNHPRVEERQQVHRYARQFELLVHFELKNFELLDYKITNTQRYLAKRKTGDEFDKVLLNGFRQLIKAKDKTELKNQFVQLRRAIEKIFSSEELRKIEEQFEYLAWVEEKLK